jgi:hypothetical protein
MMWPVEWLSEWRVAPLPQGSLAASSASLEAFAISAETLHRDACWQWITYLSRQMTYRLVPPRRSLAESEEYEQALGEEIAEAALISLESAVTFSPRIWTALANEYGAFVGALDQIVEGTMQPREALDAAAVKVGR